MREHQTENRCIQRPRTEGREAREGLQSTSYLRLMRSILMSISCKAPHIYGYLMNGLQIQKESIKG